MFRFAVGRNSCIAFIVGWQVVVLTSCNRRYANLPKSVAAHRVDTKSVGVATLDSESPSKASESPETGWTAQPQVENSIVIGIDADMSSGAAQAGEAIRRGVALALDEINAEGGLLGRPVECVVRDHRGNPSRGVDNITEFAQMRDVLAVVGGIHTPVALQELDVIHREQMLYLDPWAAGTPVVDNGRNPNFVFRVSVRDEYAGEFLIQKAVERGFKNVGLMLERTGWGRSNEKAMLAALESRNMAAAGIKWFNWGERSVSKLIEELVSAEADVIVFVGNPLEGAVTVNNMASLPSERRLPIISHWGITGGDFPQLTGDNLSEIDLSFLQTYSFITPPYPDRAEKLFEAYAMNFGCDSPRKVIAPVGTAHAYEIVMLLAEATRRANSLDRAVVREELESPIRYEGIIRDYDPPFRPDHHDALNASDFVLARYDEDGAIVPIPSAREN